MCRTQELKIKQKINGELKYLGYNLDYLGSKYIAETIYMLYIVNEYYNFNLETDIYPIIARKIGKSVNNVKCNIKNATEIMYYESEEEKIMRYLENNDKNKPKPKKIMKSVLKRIK